MLQQQINYWGLKETMRHNRVGEAISQQEADSNRMNANTNITNAESNRITANANSRNAESNAINAVSNRIQANAATVQGYAAMRNAGANERQAGVAERNVAVTEALYDSKNYNNYVSPLGSALGQGVSMFGIPLKGGKPITKTTKPTIPKGVFKDSEGYWTTTKPTGAANTIVPTALKGGAITMGVVGGAYVLKTVYDYNKVNDTQTFIRQR